MYNNSYALTEVISNTDYLFFKKGVRPEWEDPENRDGGKWVVTLPIQEHLEEECEQAWLALLLNVVGSQFSFEETAIINGMIYSIRDKHMRMSLWCKSAENMDTVTSIGKKFKDLAKFDSKYKFGF